MTARLVHDRLVRLSDVQHEIGNGLQSPRVHAEALLHVLEVLVRLDLVAMQPLHELALKRVRRILEGIDETVARVQALAPAETEGESQ